MIMMIVAGMIFLALRGSRALNRGQQPQQLGAGPVRYGETPLGDAARASLDADITRFGDELRDLDLDVVGLELSEEARANGKGIDAKTIQSLKVGLMGPLCGVGDPLIWGTLRPIAAALGAALAVTGNPLGPILFFVLFNVVRLAVKWLGLSYGYKAGLGIVRDLSGNVLPKLTEGATVLGLFVMGVLITKWTTINIPLIVSSTVANGVTTTTTVQNILDELCPGLLGLGLTLLSMRLLKNRVSPIILIFILFAVGIAGYGLGLLA